MVQGSRGEGGQPSPAAARPAAADHVAARRLFLLRRRGCAASDRRSQHTQKGQKAAGLHPPRLAPARHAGAAFAPGPHRRLFRRPDAEHRHGGALFPGGLGLDPGVEFPARSSGKGPREPVCEGRPAAARGHAGASDDRCHRQLWENQHQEFPPCAAFGQIQCPDDPRELQHHPGSGAHHPGVAPADPSGPDRRDGR